MPALAVSPELASPDLADPVPALQLDRTQALQLAVRMHRDEQLDAASALYRSVLAVAPDDPDALHLLGVLRHQQGADDEAIALLARAVAAAPEIADYHNDLGNLHAARRDYAAAAACYAQAVARAPDCADFHVHLAMAHQLADRFDDARASFQRALTLDPDNRRALAYLGELYCDAGEHRAALPYVATMLEMAPESWSTRLRMLRIYQALAMNEAAAKVYRAWLADYPDDPSLRHALAACSGEDVPERAADAYVEQLFDGSADAFDAHLIGHLDYVAPQRCAALLARLRTPERALAVLDAGCGTGLCGPLLAPFSRVLEGVDLSAGMLAHARARGIYGALHKAELTAFLEARGGAWDVIASADTLCYFGDLSRVARAFHGALRPDGVVVFSVEAQPARDGAPYRLQMHGRYTHARAHLEAALRGAGFHAVVVESSVLRTELGAPVAGFVVAAQRAPA